jgi:hypothetical protein
MHDPRSIAEALHRAADSVARLDAVSDWVDDDGELLLSTEAAMLAGVTPETVRRWASDHRLGRCFANSVWIISARRLFEFIERTKGKSAMLEARSRRKTLQSASSPEQSTRMLVVATG